MNIKTSKGWYMKNYKNIFLGLVTGGTLVACFSAGAVQSYAQSQDQSADSGETIVISEIPGTPNWDYPAERGPWPTRLGLSDGQMEQLVSLKSEYSINTAKQKAELQANMKTLILLMTEPKLDKQAVFAMNEKIDQLKTALADARVNQMLAVMNVMTPKQREDIRHHMLVRALSQHHSMGSKHHKGSEHHEHHEHSV